MSFRFSMMLLVIRLIIVVNQIVVVVVMFCFFDMKLKLSFRNTGNLYLQQTVFLPFDVHLIQLNKLHHFLILSITVVS